MLLLCSALVVFIYNIFLIFFRAGIHFASLFNQKAKKWVSGRKNILDRLEKDLDGNKGIVWMHCASLGEFEQGRPILEEIRRKWPDKRILLTFFSPSGYEVRKNYEGADWIYYLPLDGAVTVRRFLEITQPALVIFVKYEFWYYYLKKIKYRNIPLLLISAHFRKEMSFFKWYGALQRKMLSRFDHIFVQNEGSKILLEEIGINNIVTVSGDTRFDRVISISEKFSPIPAVEGFVNGKKCVVAGSTWSGDEKVLAEYFNSVSYDHKLIIAPHEIDEQHLTELEILFSDTIRFSRFDPVVHNHAKVLIIDNIGMLSRLYHYANVCFIGGGFHKGGIHNILEAAVFSKPVVYGPVYKKYREAVELISVGGAKSIASSEELKKFIATIENDQASYRKMAEASGKYVWVNKGASDTVIRFIQEKRLLTN